jgi:hypothetical protein
MHGKVAGSSGPIPLSVYGLNWHHNTSYFTHRATPGQIAGKPSSSMAGTHEEEDKSFSIAERFNLGVVGLRCAVEGSIA